MDPSSRGFPHLRNTSQIHKLEGKPRYSSSSLQQGDLSINEVNEDVNVIKLQNEFETEKLEISKKSRTAKICIHSLDYISTLRYTSKRKESGYGLCNLNLHAICLIFLQERVM